MTLIDAAINYSYRNREPKPNRNGWSYTTRSQGILVWQHSSGNIIQASKPTLYLVRGAKSLTVSLFVSSETEKKKHYLIDSQDLWPDVSKIKNLVSDLDEQFAIEKIKYSGDAESTDKSVSYIGEIANGLSKQVCRLRPDTNQLPPEHDHIVDLLLRASLDSGWLDLSTDMSAAMIESQMDDYQAIEDELVPPGQLLLGTLIAYSNQR